MHDPSIGSSAPLSDWFEGNTLCLRRQDKQAIAAVPEILLGGRPYVVVVGPSAGLISHYFELIYRQVKAADDLVIDVFLPATADGLLARFNDVLADLSVAEARQPPTTKVQRRILMLSESSDLGQREWDLLARLLGDFPAANFGLLVFIDEPDNPLVQSFIKSMGTKLNQCALNYPNGDELQKLLAAADGEVQESQVLDTLRRLGVSFGDKAGPTTGTGVANVNPRGAGKGVRLVTGDDSGRQGFKQPKQLLLGLFIAIIVSVAVSLALNDELTPESLVESATAWMPMSITQGWTEANPDTPLSTPPAAAGLEGIVDAEVEPTPPALQGPVTGAVQNIEEPARQDAALQVMAESTKAAPVTIAEAGMAAPQDVPAWLVEATAKNPPPQSPPSPPPSSPPLSPPSSPPSSPPTQLTPETPDAVAVSLPPALLIDPEGYYLQFNALRAEASATRERERLAPNFDAHTLRLESSGGVVFVVVAGPYRTLFDAIEAKEAANNVDVIVVRGAQLQRRQVLEAEVNFD